MSEIRPCCSCSQIGIGFGVALCVGAAIVAGLALGQIGLLQHQIPQIASWAMVGASATGLLYFVILSIRCHKTQKPLDSLPDPAPESLHSSPDTSLDLEEQQDSHHPSDPLNTPRDLEVQEDFLDPFNPFNLEAQEDSDEGLELSRSHNEVSSDAVYRDMNGRFQKRETC